MWLLFFFCKLSKLVSNNLKWRFKNMATENKEFTYYVWNNIFQDEDRMNLILSLLPKTINVNFDYKSDEDISQISVFRDDHEKNLFLSLNYLNFKKTETQSDEFDEKIKEIKEIIVSYNIPLVLKSVKIYRRKIDSSSCHMSHDSLLAVAKDTLINCIDLFNIDEGNRFSTYYVNSINNRFINHWKEVSEHNKFLTSMREQYYRLGKKNFIESSFGLNSEASCFYEKDPLDNLIEKEEQEEQDKVVNEFCDKLNSREKVILEKRITAATPEGLKFIEKELGISMARISQIEKSLRKNLMAFAATKKDAA